MQAVILAAGQSTRTYPLTLTRPKPLLPLANKPIIVHTLERLKGIVDEVILVVGYKKDMIIDYLGDEFQGMTLKYVEQKEQLGTAHALSLVEEHIKGDFLLLMGDDLYEKEDIAKLAENVPALLVTEVDNPELFGVVKEEGEKLVDIIEKPKEFISNKISTACYGLPSEIFSLLKELSKSERGEYEIPDALRVLTQKNPVICITASHYLPIGFPWDVLKADQYIRQGKEVAGEGTEVSGRVEKSSLGKNCVIKGTVKNSLLLDNVIVEEGSVVENSVLGEGVVFSGKALAAQTTSFVKGKSIEVGVFGCALGDEVKATDVSIAAGVKVYPNKEISGTVEEDQE